MGLWCGSIAGGDFSKERGCFKVRVVGARAGGIERVRLGVCRLGRVLKRCRRRVWGRAEVGGGRGGGLVVSVVFSCGFGLVFRFV